MISVCIATYNGARFIRKQLESILPQLGEKDEVVVSDDGSVDGTVSAVESLHDSRIRVVTGPKKGTPVLNFEHALKEAKGDYIFLSDQDDVWMPEKVDVMMRYLEKYDCVCSDCEVVYTDQDEKILHKNPSFYAYNNTRQGVLYNLFLKNGYLGCCMAFNRKVLKKALPFPVECPMHDIWLGNISACYYSMKFIPEKLIIFHRHNSNASTTGRPSAYTLYGKIRLRLVVAMALMKRLLK